jgi:hypothetical protein
MKKLDSKGKKGVEKFIEPAAYCDPLQTERRLPLTS